MAKLRLQHPGGRGSTVFEVDPDGHDVLVKFPVRTQYGLAYQAGRFQPSEAIALAELLVVAAEQADAPGPRVEP